MTEPHYNKKLKGISRALRSTGTKGEAILWKYVLRARKTGFQFNRQYIIERYIVDFVCRKLKLIVEVDGSSHNSTAKSEKDYNREMFLRDLGYEVLRFSEKDVHHSLSKVADAINYAVEARKQELDME
jgi:very-short-patch-repair endonuclease